ncbi:mycofactocin biosynthesis glycosyltransferase MftF [Sciscionella sediminilitoris]|uniref:mycofactocin biosynthesis glycosyltransferase MftF n=1 Tax=Sciscionella sediminilitoris TaxID=1445613 RepID=UPI0009E7A800|nr:mycofactocin biosynthesis glycosyltransferase MftF [Sciscionella sp. SE31]
MTALPPDTGLVLDESVLRYGDAVIGGSPLRVLRLSGKGTRWLNAWATGQPLGTNPAAVSLARRLLDEGILQPDRQTAPYRPDDVSVVIPVKDDHEGVARLRATLPDSVTVLVVDDGSARPVSAAAVRHSRPRGPAAARNAGFRLVRTEIVAFLDADTAPEPGWLEPLLSRFGDPCVSAVAPRIRSMPGSAHHIDLYESERSSLDMGKRCARVRPMSRISYVPSAALAVRSADLSVIGGFDERLRFGEDVDLVWRLTAAGKTVRYEPESTVRHRARPKLHSWLRQRFDYGTSAAALARRHPGDLSCARLSKWSAAVWGLVTLGRPLAALTLGAVTIGWLPHRLHATGVPTLVALRLAAAGHLGAARILADAIRRGWWPIALLHPRGRLLLLASLMPCVLEAIRSRHGLVWLLLRIADDLAYSLGVWRGCMRERTLAPLLPQFQRRDL